MYLWTDDSPAAALYDADLFMILQDDIFDFEQIGVVLLAGDCNARTSNRPDCILFDNFVK